MASVPDWGHLRREGVHRRRSRTRVEIELLIGHVWDLPRRGPELLSGRDRAMLYLLATCTGLRAREIRQLEREWIDVEKGLLRVPGSVTKNNKDAVQPLPIWLNTAIAVAPHRRGPDLYRHPGRRG